MMTSLMANTAADPRQQQQQQEVSWCLVQPQFGVVPATVRLPSPVVPNSPFDGPAVIASAGATSAAASAPTSTGISSASSARAPASFSPFVTQPAADACGPADDVRWSGAPTEVRYASFVSVDGSTLFSLGDCVLVPSAQDASAQQQPARLVALRDVQCAGAPGGRVRVATLERMYRAAELGLGLPANHVVSAPGEIFDVPARSLHTRCTLLSAQQQQQYGAAACAQSGTTFVSTGLCYHAQSGSYWREGGQQPQSAAAVQQQQPSCPAAAAPFQMLPPPTARSADVVDSSSPSHLVSPASSMMLPPLSLAISVDVAEDKQHNTDASHQQQQQQAAVSSPSPLPLSQQFELQRAQALMMAHQQQQPAASEAFKPAAGCDQLQVEFQQRQRALLAQQQQQQKLVAKAELSSPEQGAAASVATSAPSPSPVQHASPAACEESSPLTKAADSAAAPAVVSPRHRVQQPQPQPQQQKRRSAVHPPKPVRAPPPMGGTRSKGRPVKYKFNPQLLCGGLDNLASFMEPPRMHYGLSGSSPLSARLLSALASASSPVVIHDGAFQQQQQQPGQPQQPTAGQQQF